MATADDDFDLAAFLGREPRSAASRIGRWIVAALLVLTLVLIIWWLLFGGRVRAEYRTAEVRRGNLAVTVTAVGNIVPTNQVAVGSQISGLVTRVLVDANDHVAQGQPLAILDTRRMRDAIRVDQANIAQSKASVAQQQATLAEAQAQMARLREVNRLSGGKTPSSAELSAQIAAVQRAEAGLRLAEAQVEAAVAQLSSDRTQIGYAVIRSPVAGVILTRQIEPGQTVAASFSTPTLFTVADNLARMKLDIAVDEADVGLVRAGQHGEFTVDSFPQRRFNAVVRKINFASNNLGNAANKVVSYTATLDVDNPDISLRPGMTAAVTIRVQNLANVLLVPNAALRFVPLNASARHDDIKFRLIAAPREAKERSVSAGSRQFLYTLDTRGHANPIEVQTGSSDGSVTVISSTKVTAGTRVVTGQTSGTTE